MNLITNSKGNILAFSSGTTDFHFIRLAFLNSSIKSVQERVYLVHTQANPTLLIADIKPISTISYILHLRKLKIIKMSVLVANFRKLFNAILILSLLNQAYSQGSFVINQVFHDAEEWVVKETYLDHKLSGELLNAPGGLTKYGTELGNYVHNRDIDGSRGICVKLNKNGSWNKIRCPGPKTERLIDNGGRHKYISYITFYGKFPFHNTASLRINFSCPSTIISLQAKLQPNRMLLSIR